MSPTGRTAQAGRIIAQIPATLPPALLLAATLLPALLLNAAPGAAQDTTLPTGVHLRLVYETQYHPRVAVPPFNGPGMEAVADEVHRIVRRDLDYSDRFEMLTAIPAALREGADYRAWNNLGVVWLVTGGIQPADGTGFTLRLALHDVVYGRVREIRVFELPPRDDPDFRLAVHAASDEVVRWATGEPGIAATRIALTLKGADNSHQLLIVDSDGEGLRRVPVDGSVYSPAWSPDGAQLAYDVTDYISTDRVVERHLGSGQTAVRVERNVPMGTVAYAPDGRRLATAIWGDGGMDLFDYDVARGRLRRLNRSRAIDMHPSYSPDGRRVVFQSDRLPGSGPHIFIMPAEGGEATLITPYQSGEWGFYAAPEWSPTGGRIAFTGRSKGVDQVMYADADRPGGPVQQITAEGRSEDPSWAPDGRHLVFRGIRDDGQGLYVIDLVTGRIRPLLLGARYRMPSWSPHLHTPASAPARDP